MAVTNSQGADVGASEPVIPVVPRRDREDIVFLRPVGIGYPVEDDDLADEGMASLLDASADGEQRTLDVVEEFEGRSDEIRERFVESDLEGDADAVAEVETGARRHIGGRAPHGTDIGDTRTPSFR